ncbi:hypothetical protein KV557_37465 [Kitasatospora aureofaciens]|uniref:hypothetical protein n=1 Tax=Kitasatospora aureofaciens TaxID=1894 RepID=UPI001C468DCD|nr:hypothetical protein [Kitasatospora aureofaciens]MBV6702725.1 hypothetical protein [Kitasatospora aureofaciens]
MLVVEWLGGAVPAKGGDVDGTQLAGAGPADEVPSCLAVFGGVVGEPAVEVGLSAGVEREVVGPEPVQEGDGRMGALTHGSELLRGDGAAVVESPKAPDQVPARVAVEKLPLVGILLGCEKAGEEAFDADHVLVAFGQSADTDEYLAQMGEGRAVGQFVQGLVRQRPPASGEVGHDGGDGPGGGGVLGGGDVVPQGFESGME